MRKPVLTAIFVLMVMNPAMAIRSEDGLVPITQLGVAPWLGEIKEEKDLAVKFAGEKTDFVRYIQYDLKQAVNLNITNAETREIVDSTETTIKERRIEEISIPDGTIFKSMGWKSRTGEVMRTPNPILKLGRQTKGFLVKVDFKEYQIEYVFLKDCGNLCLLDVKTVSPPRAEYVPSALSIKEEVPPPPERPTETYVYVYVSPPVYYRRYSPFIYYRSSFRGVRGVNGLYPYYVRRSGSGFYTRSATVHPRASFVRTPTVRTRTSVHTRSPVVRSSGSRVR